MPSRAEIKVVTAEIQAGLREAFWTRGESVMVLAEIARDRGKRDSDRVRAVAELNKMHGFEAPQKVEHDLSFVSILRELDARTTRKPEDDAAFL